MVCFLNECNQIYYTTGHCDNFIMTNNNMYACIRKNEVCINVYNQARIN